MTDQEERSIERARLIRQVRQRLEGLGLAGIDRVETPKWRTDSSSAKRPATTAAPSPPVAVAVAATAPAPIAPSAPVEVPPPPQARASEPISIGEILSKPTPTIRTPTAPAIAGGLFEAGGFDSPPPDPEEKARLLEELSRETAACVRCPALASSRTQTVFGTGDPNAALMFVGEAPGEDEDRLGVPFIGRAGQLLTDMITKGMGLTRDQVFIANVVKCRPTEGVNKNRPPTPQEMATCRPFIERQIEIVRPKFLCLLGKSAASSLLETGSPMAMLRNRWFRYRGIPTMVTFHPSYLLRTPEDKKLAWEDLKRLMQAMGIQPPDRKKTP